MFHELLFALAAGLILLYQLRRMATDGARRPVISDSWSNSSDPKRLLYRSAEDLFEEGNFAAAAATVTYVTSADSDCLAANAWLMLAQCHMSLDRPVDALDAAESGMRLIAESVDKESREMRWLTLAFLVLKANILTQMRRTQEQQWHVLEEARQRAESDRDAFATDEQWNLYLAFCYHNLGALSHNAGDTATASAYYQRAAALWAALPDRPNSSANLEEARSGFRDSEVDFLNHLFGLNYEGPDS